jgi:hypothetical protein
MELEFCTNQQLIDELVNRSTFAGIIIYSEDENRDILQNHDQFDLVTKTSPQETIDVLEAAIQELQPLI